MRVLFPLLVLVFSAAAAGARPIHEPVGSLGQSVCADCVLHHIDALSASDFNGRGCASVDESRAAQYLGRELQSAGAVAAFGPDFIQTVPLTGKVYASPPVLQVGATKLTWASDVISPDFVEPFEGRLVRVTSRGAVGADLKGALVFYDPEGPGDPAQIRSLRADAAAVIVAAPPELLDAWDSVAGAPPGRSLADGQPALAIPRGASAIYARPDAVARLRAEESGASVRLEAAMTPYEGATHNVVGVVRGTDPDADRNAILLSAHYDHLGRMGGKLYPGANDDASGTAAVLEFARIIGKGPRPRRTVYFALFGCEEQGGFGATWFRAHPAGGDLRSIAANIEFEMVGFPDPKRPEALMVTGWERSNLGPTLAVHGAKVGPDLYPEGYFFQRSDNYALALKGVVAHTISAWPTPPTYHQPTDTFQSLDKVFLTRMVASLAPSIVWLANSDFRPAWNPGGAPGQ